jgi:TRAP-type C4-dicarboxylate transport system substrate-binding protein
MGVLSIAVLAGAGCGAAVDRAGGRAPVPVRVLHVLSTRGEEDVRPFLDRLGQLSGGALQLEIQHKWERQNPAADVDVIGALRAGKADLAVVPARAWHAVGVTSFDALVAPFAVDSMAVQEMVLASDVPTGMLNGVEPLGLVGIAVLPGPMRHPAGVTRALRQPSDFAGARIGFSPSVVAERSLQALGAVAVESAFEGTPIGGLDGIEVQTTVIPQYDGAVRYVTGNVNLWPRPNVLVATAEAFGSLNSTQLGWLRSAARDSIGAIIASQIDIGEDLGLLCRHNLVQFVNATSEQLAALRAAVVPVQMWLRQDPGTARFLDRIAAIRTGGTPKPDEIPSCAGITATDRPSTRVRTPFDGTYRMVTTQTDAAVDPQQSPENWGTWTFVFDRGRFAITQENERACTWGYGTYTVSGDTVTWLFTDGGGIAPTNAQNKPGEQFTFRWSAYKERMTLSAQPGAISPLPLFLSPWRRLGTDPSAAELSQRCPPPASALAV